MIIATLKNLTQDEIEEIVGDHDTVLGKLGAVLCNGAEVAVLSIEVDNGNLDHNYYNVIFANGFQLQGLSGCHLRGIQNWK